MNEQCCICGGEFHKIGNIGKSSYGYCENCHLSFNIPTSKVSYEGFSQNYPTRWLLNEENELFMLARFRYKWITKNLHLKTGKIMDIGCGYGHFLKVFADRGWYIYGIDTSSKETEFAKEEFGLSNIYVGDFLNANMENKNFDVISINHILEHLENPRTLIKKAEKLLKKNGKIFITVPDQELLKPNIIVLWFISQGLHLFNFTKQSLINLLSASGFKPLAIENEPATKINGGASIIAAFSKSSNSEQLPIKPDGILHLHEFFESYKTVMRKVSKWFSIVDSCAIFGAGFSTTALFDLLGYIPPNIRFIIDDNPDKQGSNIRGIPIHNKYILKDNIDIPILITPYASENEIYKNILKEFPSLKVYRLHNDIMEVS